MKKIKLKEKSTAIKNKLIVEKDLIAKDIKKKKEKLDQKVAETKDYVRKNPVKARTVFLIGLMGFLIFILTTVIIFSLYIIFSSPNFDPNMLYEKEASILLDKDGNEFARLGVENRELITYEELPQVLIDAIVATEDSRFFRHNGFDIARFMKASIGQFTGNTNAGGASTLSMQVNKNTFTSTNASGIKGIVRKFTDIYMSIFKIEKNYTKEEIIEFYVNAPFLGNYSYGVEQASKNYFGKSVSDLSLSEAALIAGLFQAPGTYNPYVYPENATKRRATVLNLMEKHGYITKEQRDAAKIIDVRSLIVPQSADKLNLYQGFVDTVVEEVLERTKNNPYNTPMLIYTTLDPKIQDQVNNVTNGTAYTFVDDKVQVGIAVTDVNDGSIRAIGNGRNQTKERAFNYATMTHNHPGSSAKPFLDYGPWFEYYNGSTYTQLFDEPYKYKNGKSIKNVDLSYMGQITLRTALRKSRNIPALQTFHKMDTEKISELVHAVGWDYGEFLYESAAVGAFEGVSPLQSSAAYGTLSRGGYYIEPYSFTKIEYRTSGDTETFKYPKSQAMSESTAYMLNNVLNGAVLNPTTGSGANATMVSGKTGTSSADKDLLKKLGISGGVAADSWLSFYSPEYAISLWYGYDKITKEYHIRGNEAYNPRSAIAKYLVAKVLNTGNGKSFKRPNNVISVDIEKESVPGSLPSPYTPKDMIVTELYKRGTQPSEVSWRYSQLKNVKSDTVNKSVNSNVINLSWQKVETPNAINTSFLQSYFNENYGDYAEKYYNKRIDYNNAYIGNVGYNVYIKNSDNSLSSLGFTNNNSFSYNIPSSNQTAYSFVIKTAYSIFKDNMSSGVEVTVNTVNNVLEEVDISLNGNNEQIAKATLTSACYQETNYNDPVIVEVNGSELSTNNYSVTREYYNTNSNKISCLRNDPVTTTGQYFIKYIVKYNNKIYDQNVERIITIN